MAIVPEGRPARTSRYPLQACHPHPLTYTGGMAAPYTPRQGQYLAFIHAYITRYGRSPSEAEIAEHFMVSAPSAHGMVVALERRGLIERTQGEGRSIRLMLSPTLLPAPEGASGHRPSAEYPHLAAWIVDGGMVELGRAGEYRSMARALDEGGLVWEGKARYRSLHELLIDLDRGIATWQTDNP